MAMSKTEVLALLKENRNERGIAHWEKKPRRLKSFGIGLTRLRKLAKRVGRDHELARQLWNTDIYDAKVLGLLIDDPQRLSREQAEDQVEHLGDGMLAHVFASCDATLAKTPFAFELADEWMESKDDMRRRCGFTLLSELPKKNPKGMDDDYLLARIDHIRHAIEGEDMWVRAAMAGALIRIGKRNKRLNAAAVRTAKTIGPVEIDYGNDNRCEPINALKHLTSDYLKQKLAG